MSSPQKFLSENFWGRADQRMGGRKNIGVGGSWDGQEVMAVGIQCDGKNKIRQERWAIKVS